MVHYKEQREEKESKTVDSAGKTNSESTTNENAEDEVVMETNIATINGNETQVRTTYFKFPL